MDTTRFVVLRRLGTFQSKHDWSSHETANGIYQYEGVHVLDPEKPVEEFLESLDTLNMGKESYILINGNTGQEHEISDAKNALDELQAPSRSRGI